jgi:phosphatidylglycerol:prolipoprotein diacylglycerol transferase
MLYPDIDPVALSLGPIKVHWYGIMYLVGFFGAWALARYRARQPASGWSAQQVDDLIFYGALGVILGGRLGYTLFYNFPAFLDNPLSLFAIWRGGMSFHGGLLGVAVALLLFARRHNKGFFQVADFTAPLTPIGLLAGRIGNFINGELWGAPTDVAWGMEVPCYQVPDLCAFPIAAGATSPPLHPSQLYEAGLEGLLLFGLVWWFSARPRPPMAVTGLFLLGYGVFRFAVEFVRLPDAHIGYIAFDWVTMGQILSLPMILGGAILLLLARHPANNR